jgi:hypothetical protein
MRTSPSAVSYHDRASTLSVLYMEEGSFLVRGPAQSSSTESCCGKEEIQSVPKIFTRNLDAHNSHIETVMVLRFKSHRCSKCPPTASNSRLISLKPLYRKISVFQ